MMSIPGPWDKLETDTWEIFKIWVSLEWSEFWSKSLSQTSGHGLGQDMGTGTGHGDWAKWGTVGPVSPASLGASPVQKSGLGRILSILGGLERTRILDLEKFQIWPKWTIRPQLATGTRDVHPWVLGHIWDRHMEDFQNLG